MSALALLAIILGECACIVYIILHIFVDFKNNNDRVRVIRCRFLQIAIITYRIIDQRCWCVVENLNNVWNSRIYMQCM